MSNERSLPETGTKSIKKEDYQFTFSGYPGDIKVAVIVSCMSCPAAGFYLVNPRFAVNISIEPHRLESIGFRLIDGKAYCKDCLRHA